MNQPTLDYFTMKSTLLVIHALFIALSTAGGFNQTCKYLDIHSTMIKARCLMDNHELSEIEVQIDLNKCGPCADRGEMCSGCFDMGQEGKVQCLLAGTEKFYMKPSEPSAQPVIMLGTVALTADD
jgi:hypothetical protein